MNDREDVNSLRTAWAEKRRTIAPKSVRLNLQEGAPQEAAPKTRTTQDVKMMYENYPYPSPVVGESLLRDLSNAVGFLLPGKDLSGWRILDAGCGTGHRVLGLARDYPKAVVTAIDMTETSLRVARQLALKHRIENVMFKEANLLELNLTGEFDLIVSTGVIHHLTDPERGLRNLCARLSPEGIIMIWLYHPYGEFARLLSRELVLLLWGEGRKDYQEGVAIAHELGLNLSARQYGTQTSTLVSHDLSQTSINVDAYLHPIVKAYRFGEALDLLKLAGSDWVAANGLNSDGESKLIDLEQVSDEGACSLVDRGIFTSEKLLRRYRGLSKSGKLKAIELVLRPTGFNVIGGKNRSFEHCDERVRHNVIWTRADTTEA
jgi:2-polyprenyl-3-methyl-5-hydroxy-6-metoxy-1,4-benzoquinol methylase